ncbi:MAG: hypothetical protein AAB965_02275 [Patescibacteria group bacterium]
MKLPIVIDTKLDNEALKKWQVQFVDTGRTALEGLWRRTQEEVNKKLSDWEDAGDKRRRILHYRDQYELAKQEDGTYSLLVTNPYLWLSVSLPESEMKEYLNKFHSALEKGNWDKIKEDGALSIYRNEDLYFKIISPVTYQEDARAGRTFPADYVSLDVTLSSGDSGVTEEFKEHPWAVLDTGVRQLDVRGNPKVITDFKDLSDLLPAQMSLGCGPSIEAGIPPLHYLHGVYYVTNRETGKFILGPKKDNLLIEIAEDPKSFFQKSSVPYQSALRSKPTDFYLLLGELHREGKLVGPIITNNFDGLSSCVGLTERYVRKYSEQHITPHIDFDPGAKSLLVIGEHADRRRIHHSAREQGLNVIYIDPEGYGTESGFISYPLESAQDRDFLIKMTAAEFTEKWRKTFGN